MPGRLLNEVKTLQEYENHLRKPCHECNHETHRSGKPTAVSGWPSRPSSTTRTLLWTAPTSTTIWTATASLEFAPHTWVLLWNLYYGFRSQRKPRPWIRFRRQRSAKAASYAQIQATAADQIFRDKGREAWQLTLHAGGKIADGFPNIELSISCAIIDSLPTPWSK